MIDISITPEARTSERQLYKRCPWAWHQAYRQGLRPKRVKDALWFGEIVHISLAGWYRGPGLKRGPYPAETFQKLSAAEEMRFLKTTDATEEERAKYTDLRELGVAMLEGYVNLYGRDDSWHVISPEQTFSFNVPFPSWWDYEEVREFMTRYVGTYDLVYRDLVSDWIWLGEHKTAKTIRVDHLPLDDQAGPYFATARTSLIKQGLISPKDHFKGIMYNFLRKALPDPRPVDEQGYALNKDGSRSKVQPSPLFRRHPVPRTRAEQKSQLQRMQNDLAVMELARRGEIPITKTTHWSCARLCDFYDICRLHESSGNWKDLRSIGFRVEDPYADHRKSTEEIGTFEL